MFKSCIKLQPPLSLLSWELQRDPLCYNLDLLRNLTMAWSGVFICFRNSVSCPSFRSLQLTGLQQHTKYSIPVMHGNVFCPRDWKYTYLEHSQAYEVAVCTERDTLYKIASIFQLYEQLYIHKTIMILKKTEGLFNLMLWRPEFPSIESMYHCQNKEASWTKKLILMH